MPAKKHRTPQEKKQLSLAKDRRNNFGESSKASRKLIPLRKAQANRTVRRTAKHALNTDGQIASDEMISKQSNKKWQKVSDTSLADTIAKKTSRRQECHGAKNRRIAAHQRTEENGLPDPVMSFTSHEE